MNAKNVILTTAIAVVLLIAAVGSVSAIDINNCTVINAPGVYDITANITNSTQKHSIEVKSDDVIIEGHGHWIDGVNSATGRSGIHYWKHNAVGNNITIRDVEIKNFDYGIWFEGTGGTGKFTNIVVENCLIHDNGNTTDGPGQGIYLGRVCDSRIKGNEVYNQTGTGSGCEAGGNGVFLYDGKNNSFTCNNLHHNRKGGIFLKMKPTNNTISYNNLWKNGEDNAGTTGGIILRCKLCNYNLIAYNNASNNFMNGIYIGGSNNTIEYNIVINNSDNGIDIGRSDGGDYNELYYNTVCNNGGADIRTCGGTDPSSGCYGNHGVNNTCDTTSYYNDEGATGCTYPCSAGVIADFSAEPTKGTSPLEVAFIDRSKPEVEITGWLWDFGDGDTSSEENPTHTYCTLDPYNYYNISLTVTGTGGASDTVTRTDYIKVWKEDAAPNADFLCSKGVGVPSVPVQFTDKSLGEVTSWLWDFGDGETNTTQNPEHYYSAEGIYNVSLTVTGAGGSSKETKFLCVRVGSGSGEKWPLIDAHFFASARTGNAPFTVTFTDVSRSASEIDSWEWDFGDGNISSEKNPTHRYNNAGTYNVSLEVTNTEDAKAKEIKIGYIEVKEEAIFDTGAPENPYPSIFGTHKGKIIPDRDITVNRMYTYPCKGTGGHTEYVRIWNESEAIDGIGNWSGYQGDYHNLTISPAITLLKNHEYNYIIRTGSYPQIIHAREYKAVEGGNITCEEFIDANGRKYDDWIPAIRLE